MRLSPSACTAGIRVRAVQASARKVLIARSIVGSLASTCHTQPSAMDTLHQGSTVRLSRVLGPLCVAVLSSFILLQNPQSMASLMTQALLLLSCLVLPTSFVLIHSGLHRRQKIIRIAVLLAAAVAVCGWRTIQSMSRASAWCVYRRPLRASLCKLVSDVGSMLESQNVTWWIWEGDMLSAIRKSGPSIWEHDADICVLDSDISKLTPALQAYVQATRSSTRDKSKVFHGTEQGWFVTPASDGPSTRDFLSRQRSAPPASPGLPHASGVEPTRPLGIPYTSTAWVSKLICGLFDACGGKALAPFESELFYDAAPQLDKTPQEWNRHPSLEYAQFPPGGMPMIDIFYCPATDLLPTAQRSVAADAAVRADPRSQLWAMEYCGGWVPVPRHVEAISAEKYGSSFRMPQMGPRYRACALWMDDWE